ncbi:MAG TPA: hypothetical protein VGR57_05820 [Ktedonobacterales bacterium]|nr:hypothetical protein [Ktedonobacterales bacterium]
MIEPCSDCACPDECDADGACYWRRYVASLNADERAVMDEYEAIAKTMEATDE